MPHISRAISLSPQSYFSVVLQQSNLVLPYTAFVSLISNPIACKLLLLVFIQVIWVTMVYGPIAAFLIEAFPAKIRYTSFSLPYHIGNGWFGGTLPLIAGLLVAKTGNPLAGLYWVIAIALMTFLVGTFGLSESHRVEIWKEAEEARPV